MTGKEYLQQAYIAERKIRYLQSRRELLRSDMFAVKSPSNMNPDRVQSSMSGDQMERLIARVDGLERSIVNELNDLLDLQKRISALIDKVPNPKHRYVLKARYINFHRWERIAYDMDIGVRHVYRLHGDALQSFEKVFQCH